MSRHSLVRHQWTASRCRPLLVRLAIVLLATLFGCSRFEARRDDSASGRLGPRLLRGKDSTPPRVERDVSHRTKSLACDVLTGPERRALERCAWSRMVWVVGHRGVFTIRVEMNGVELPRLSGDDSDMGATRVHEGDACHRASVELVEHLPCTWEITGPYPAYSIRVVEAR